MSACLLHPRLRTFDYDAANPRFGLKGDISLCGKRRASLPITERWRHRGIDHWQLVGQARISLCWIAEPRLFRANPGRSSGRQSSRWRTAKQQHRSRRHKLQVRLAVGYRAHRPPVIVHVLTEIPSCEAGYMAAPERFATRQIPLATRAPSIHGPKRRFAASQ